MNIDWISFVLGAGTVILGVPALLLVLAIIGNLLSTSHGRGGCYACDQGFECDTGKYTRIGIWLRTRRHDWFIATRKWHRDAWARNRWNPYRLPGYPEDNGMAAERRKKPNVLVRAWWFLS